jgi:hypothetical protein
LRMPTCSSFCAGAVGPTYAHAHLAQHMRMRTRPLSEGTSQMSLRHVSSFMCMRISAPDVTLLRFERDLVFGQSRWPHFLRIPIGLTFCSCPLDLIFRTCKLCPSFAHPH